MAKIPAEKPPEKWEDVVQKFTGVSRARGVAMNFMAEIDTGNTLIDQIYDRVREDGTIQLPKTYVEKVVGLDPSKAIKGRPNALKNHLNKFHHGLLKDDEIWHVGKSGSDAYKFDILGGQDEETVKKWMGGK